MIGLAFLLAGALGVADVVPEARTVDFLSDPYCPYNCTPGSERPGIGVEIAQRIFGSAGWTVRYQGAPWADSLERVRKGEADGVIGAYKSDAPDFAFPDFPFARSTNCFFTAGGTWRFVGPASLRGIRLGVIAEYSYGAVVDQYVEANRGGDRILVAEGETALDSLLEALSRGDIQALVEDDAVVAYRLREEGRPGFLRNAGCAAPGSVYVAFSPAPARAARTRTLLALWNAGFARLRRSGELSAISRRYE